MPSLDDSGISVSPSADPLTYPGTTIDADYLWVDSWMYGIAPGRSAGGCLGQWVVRVDGGPLGSALPASGVSLDGALSLVGAAPMSARRPVVSFGSNSAPAQLRAKFASLAPASRVVPVMRAVISGLGLGHSPHVSSPGYLPYVLVDNPHEQNLPVFVLWLDPAALQVMNGTEPNYDLVAVPAGRYPMRLHDGESIAEYAAYKGKWGALRWAGSAGPAKAMSQEDVIGALTSAEWFRALVGDGDARELIFRLRGDRALRDRIRVELHARSLVTTDGWAAAEQ